MMPYRADGNYTIVLAREKKAPLLTKPMKWKWRVCVFDAMVERSR